MFVQKSWILFVLGLNAIAFVNARAPKKDQRIVGGYLTTIKSEPHIVQVLMDDVFQCAGSILSADWVLTVAHCVYGNEDEPNIFQVRAGATYLYDKKGTIRQVLKIFDLPASNDDIAMLKLSDPLPLNGETIKAISLGSEEVPNGALVKVSGWGSTTEEGDVSSQIRSVYVPKISNEVCKQKYQGFPLKITDNMMCASEDGKDSCSGDSGGPLEYDGQLSGVASWGLGCGSSDRPGVYVNVKKFTSFIQDTMNNN